MANYSSNLVIEELGDDGSVLRAIDLRGPGLPHQGAEWGGENGLVTTWYPGNKRASQQFLGPHEVPSAWVGSWRRTLLGKVPCLLLDANRNETPIIEPGVLRDLFEDFFRHGRLLRVTWTVNAFPDDTLGTQIVREGRAKSWSFPHYKATDIDWHVTFEWIGRGDPQPVIVPNRSGDVAAAAASLEAAVSALQAQVQFDRMVTSSQKLGGSATTFNLGQLESVVNAPLALTKGVLSGLQRVVSTAKQAAGLALQARALPYSVANAGLDFARNALAASNQFHDQMTRTPPELMATRAKAADVIRATVYFGKSVDLAQVVARRAQETDERIREQRAASQGAAALSVRETSTVHAGGILAVHLLVTGDTPESLSRTYYGTTDQVEFLMRANKLPWDATAASEPRLRPGGVIVIPARTQTRTGS